MTGIELVLVLLMVVTVVSYFVTTRATKRDTIWLARTVLRLSFVFSMFFVLLVVLAENLG